MGVLTNKDIRRAIEMEELGFDPELDRFQLQPHAVDLRLGTIFKIPKAWKVTEKGREAMLIDYFSSEAKKNDTFNVIELEYGQYFEILPHEFVLASTLEEVKLPTSLAATLFPRSSLNRKGLAVDLSGVIDAGYHGKLIIPLMNKTQNQSVRLYPGERVCQIMFHNLTQETDAYQGKYLRFSGTEGVGKELPQEQELIKEGKIEKLKETFKIDG